MNIENRLSSPIVAVKTVLSDIKYLAIFLSLALFAFIVFVYIPVKTIPGNTLKFQLSIFTLKDYFLMSILALLTSLFLTMQIFIFRNIKRADAKLVTVGKGTLGGYTGILGALFATASCASCLFALFGFLGFSTLVFLLNIRWYIVIVAAIFLAISIYFSAKKVNGVCENCKINLKKPK